MTSLTVEGKTMELTGDGRLRDIGAWDESVCEALARAEGLTLTEDHWKVINTMRDYYREYNIPPVMKLLRRALRERHGEELAARRRLETLFPGGVQVQGTRIAGLPIPQLDAELEPADTPVAGGDVATTEPFEFEGRTYRLTPTGNLVEQHAWNERMAQALARREGIELTPAHWEIIYFLREFYFKYGITPMVRLLMKHLQDSIGSEKAGEKYLYKLFPGGPARQGSRIAGLYEPQGCID